MFLAVDVYVSMGLVDGAHTSTLHTFFGVVTYHGHVPFGAPGFVSPLFIKPLLFCPMMFFAHLRVFVVVISPSMMLRVMIIIILLLGDAG